MQAIQLQKNDCKERGGPKGPPKQRSNKILDLSTIFLKLLYERLQVEQSTIQYFLHHLKLFVFAVSAFTYSIIIIHGHNQYAEKF